MSTARENRYQRPNFPWTCGRACEGCPCRLGPDRRGNCGATPDCTPRWIGTDSGTGRWQCTRPATRGGPCSSGPTPDGACACQPKPCRPVRSVRGWRDLVTRLTLLGGCTLLAVVISMDRTRRPFLSPGPLTAPHQTATRNACEACHEGSIPDSGLLTSQMASSQNCLDCHNQGPTPFEPHGLSEAVLTQLASRYTNDSPSLEHWVREQLQPAKLNCSACHVEHQGTHMTLSAMTDAQCNQCHSRTFASFATGHPEFGDNYPTGDGQQITFDHASHFGEHFPDRQHRANCTDCHTSSANGFMQTLAFETGCMNCHHHSQQIEGSPEADPIIVLQLPGIDLGSMKEAGLDMAFWPIDRRRGGRRVTPVLALLLAGAETYPGAFYEGPIGKLDSDLKRVEALARGFADLREAETDDLRAVHRLAWAIRTLFFDLAGQEGIEIIRGRLERALGRKLSHTELADLTSHFPLQALRALLPVWFPQT